MRNRNKEAKLQMKAVDLFVDTLDIRSQANTYINLSLLISLLMTKEQMLLFQHQKARTINSKKQQKSDKNSKKISPAKVNHGDIHSGYTAILDGAIGFERAGKLLKLPYARYSDDKK